MTSGPNIRSKHQDLDDFVVVRRYLETQHSQYFSIIYRRYADKVFAKCISILKDESLAADALQEVFTKIFLNLAKFNEKSKFSTWIYSITYNYCIDMIRKQKKHQKLFAGDIENQKEPVEDVPDESLLEIELEKLKSIMGIIPESDKAILMMKYHEGMKIKEMAVALGKTESAIKMKIKRAKHKVLRIYREMYSQDK